MELNNHGYVPSVFFQSLVDAYNGLVLKIQIDTDDHVRVNQVEIKPDR